MIYFQHLYLVCKRINEYVFFYTMQTENIPYPFRQNSNFLYLSGSYDPEALIILCATPTEQIHMMFLSDPDPMVIEKS